MKHLNLRLLPAALIGLVSIITACNSKDDDATWDTYAEWRETNTSFYEQQKFAMNDEGKNEYTTLTPSWNNSGEILIKYLNDRRLTEGNLSPLYNSQVQVKYIGRYYNGVAFDSSYTRVDSLWDTNVAEVISGWQVALQYMRVGDSASIVVPYWMGYGSSTSSGIYPYSTLLFDIKLVDILDYEDRP